MGLRCRRRRMGGDTARSRPRPPDAYLRQLRRGAYDGLRGTYVSPYERCARFPHRAAVCFAYIARHMFHEYTMRVSAHLAHVRGCTLTRVHGPCAGSAFVYFAEADDEFPAGWWIGPRLAFDTV